MAKIVYIDSKDNVTTVIECQPETSTDGFVTKTLSLKRGKNRLKIVGYDCEDIDLKMIYTETYNQWKRDKVFEEYWHRESYKLE